MAIASSTYSGGWNFTHDCTLPIVHPKLSFKPNCFIPAKSCDFTPRSTSVVFQNYKTPYQRRKNKLNDGLICANINQDEYTCLLVLSENHSATSFFFLILQKACYSTRTRYHSPANVLRRLSENFTFQFCQCRQVIRRQSTFTLIILKYPSLIHIFAFFVLFAYVVDVIAEDGLADCPL
jgi:hypothetical protein